MSNTPGNVLDFVKNLSTRLTGTQGITVTGLGTQESPLIITITDGAISLAKLANVAAGTNGLTAGTIQATFQALTNRIKALEP